MPDKNVDPRIYLPPVEGYEHEDKSVQQTEATSADDAVLNLPSPTGLQPPQNINVVEQIFRKGVDGRTVVDLVIEVEDMPGASEYEVRVGIV